MLPSDTRLVSVDDHLIEHPMVWQERLPQAMREQGPHIVELETGAQQWCFEGVVAGTTGLSAVAGTPLKERGTDPRRFEEMRRGCWDPIARLDDMDQDGVAVQLPFPNYAGFAGSRFFRAKDKVLALECVRAYNDFVLDEWCAAAPDRYIPMVIVPFWDVQRSAEELQRCAAKGARAISFPDNPAPLGLPSFHTDHWDPLFAVVQDVGVPICMHFGTSGNTPHIADDAPLAVTTTLMGSTLFSSMVDLLMSPVLHKFPGIKVCYSEGQIGWIPFALQRMDQVWEHYASTASSAPSTPTSGPATCSESTSTAALSTTKSVWRNVTTSASTTFSGNRTTHTPTPFGPTAEQPPKNYSPPSPTKTPAKSVNSTP